MANRWGNNGNSDSLYLLGSKITADGDCSHEIKRCLLLGRKVITKLDSILKSRIALKYVYYQVWNRSPVQVGCMRQVFRACALGWPRGMGWGGRWEAGSGWGTQVNPRLIHVNIWQKPLQHCKVISLQLIKIKENRDITLSTKVHLLKAMVFSVVMNGCETWTIVRAECRRIDAFEPWCWRWLLRVPWTARRPISPS